MAIKTIFGGVLILSLVVAPLTAGESDTLGMVDVSRVFSSYKKVYKIQEAVDTDFLARRLKLDEDARKLLDDGREIQNLRKQLSGRSELLFDRVQRFQKEQFLLEKRRDDLDREIAGRMRDSMKDVLSEIRAAIHVEAEKKNCVLVFRAPDRDDLYLKPLNENNSPERKEQLTDEQQVAELLRPRTSVDLLARIMRNPVLYGSNHVDLTESVIERLNAEFARTQSVAKPVPPMPEK